MLFSNLFNNNNVAPNFWENGEARQVLDMLPQAAHVVDAKGYILYANKFLRQKYGRLIGKKCPGVYGIKSQCALCPLRSHLSVAKINQTTEVMQKIGGRFYILSCRIIKLRV